MKAPHRPPEFAVDEAPLRAAGIMLLLLSPWAAGQVQSGAAPRAPDCAAMIDDLKFYSNPGLPQAGSNQDAEHKEAAAFLFDPANARVLNGLTESKLGGADLLAYCEELVRPPAQSESSSRSGEPGAITENVEASPALKEAEEGGWSATVTAGPAYVVAGGPVKGGPGASFAVGLSNEKTGTEITLDAVKTSHGSTITGDVNATHVLLDKGIGVTAAVDAGVQHDAFNGFDVTTWARAGIGPNQINFKNLTLNPVVYLAGAELDDDVHHAKTFMPFSPAIDVAAELTTKALTVDWETELDFYRHTLWGTSDVKATTNKGAVKLQSNALVSYFGEPVAGAAGKPAAPNPMDSNYTHFGATLSAGAQLDPAGIAEKLGHLWGEWRNDADPKAGTTAL